MARIVTRVLLLVCVLMVGCAGPSPVVMTEVVTIPQTPVAVTVTSDMSADFVPDTLIVCTPATPTALLSSIDAQALIIETGAGNLLIEADDAYAYRSDLLADIPSVENEGIVATKDGTIVTYHFNEGMTWSDGEAFSVDDVIFTTQFMCQINEATGASCLAQQEKVNETTLKVTLPQSVRPGPNTLPIGVLPEHVVSELNTTNLIQSFSTLPNPVLGAYEYAEWQYLGNDRGYHVRLTQVTDPWTGPPTTPELIYRMLPDTNMLLAAFLDGECDLTPGEAFSINDQPFIRELAAQGQIAYQAVATPEWAQVTLNVAPPAEGPNAGIAFFADARVRRAVAFGTDREKMIEALYAGDGQAMHSFLPIDHPAYLPEAAALYAYDVEQARALLSAAGWQDLDGDGSIEAFNDLEGDVGCGRGRWTIPAGTLFEVTYTTGDSDVQRMTAELFAEDMAAIGIVVNVEVLAEEELAARLTDRSFQMAGFSQTADVIPDVGVVFAGENLYRTPDGDLVAATRLLADNPGLLFGIPLLERDFIMGSPPPERVPQGYTLIQSAAIPAEGNGFRGQNFGGWCDSEASLIAYEVEQALDADQAFGPLQSLQSRFLQEMPLIPLFQHIEYDLRAPYLCGPDRGPRQVATWNVEEWYFAETCP